MAPLSLALSAFHSYPGPIDIKAKKEEEKLLVAEIAMNNREKEIQSHLARRKEMREVVNAKHEKARTLREQLKEEVQYTRQREKAELQRLHRSPFLLNTQTKMIGVTKQKTVSQLPPGLPPTEKKMFGLQQSKELKLSPLSP